MDFAFCFLNYYVKKTLIFISTTVLWLPVGCLIIQVSLKNFSFRREQGEMHLKSNERKLNCPSYLTKLRYTLTFAKGVSIKSICIIYFSPQIQFVCFKGRIKPLPDELKPPLGTSETRGYWNGLCSCSPKQRTPSTPGRCIRSLGPLMNTECFMKVKQNCGPEFFNIEVADICELALP